MKLYLRVTNDKYELPLAVADSPRELSEMVGSSTDTINAILSKKRNGASKYDCGYKEIELFFDYEKFRETYKSMRLKKMFAIEMGISDTALRNWAKGIGSPLYGQILLMADYLEVESDYFLKEVPV